MKLFLIIILGVSLAACRSDADIRREMAAAEERLQEAPDSALHMLEHIGPAGIRGERVRAEYALPYSMALDKNHIFVKSDSTIRIARDFYRHHIEQRQRATESALRAARQRLRLTAALAAVSVLLAGYVACIYRRKMRRTKAQYLSTIEDMQRENQILLLKLENRKEADTVKMRKLVKERFGVINELAATYYERQGANEQKAIFNKVKALLDSYAPDKKGGGKCEIEEVVNACYDDIMVKVRRELPELKESELDLLRYIYAGFPLRVISVFTGDSINCTAVKKSRLKAKIAHSKAPSKNRFIESMR